MTAAAATTVFYDQVRALWKVLGVGGKSLVERKEIIVFH